MARGLCQIHYHEARKGGGPWVSRYVKGAPSDRLIALSTRSDSGCLIWTGNLNRGGYGRVSIGNKSFLAHRLAYALWRGPVEDGDLVCHKCDTPGCIEPSHLFLGSNADNMADKVAKGRQQRGESHPSAALSEEEVKAIRADGRTQRQIAKAFVISQQQVSFIKRYAEWQSLALTEDDRVAIAERLARLEKGQRFAHCKLTPDDVRAIRRDGRSQPEIAADYGVAKSLIYRVKARTAWRHVE